MWLVSEALSSIFQDACQEYWAFQNFDLEHIATATDFARNLFYLGSSHSTLCQVIMLRHQGLLAIAIACTSLVECNMIVKKSISSIWAWMILLLHTIVMQVGQWHSILESMRVQHQWKGRYTSLMNILHVQYLLGTPCIALVPEHDWWQWCPYAWKILTNCGSAHHENLIVSWLHIFQVYLYWILMAWVLVYWWVNMAVHPTN